MTTTTKGSKSDHNLRKLFPQIAREWHPTRNGGLKPNEVAPYCGKKVWWICAKNHEWEMIISDRSRGMQRCPYCSGRRPSPENNLAVNRPDLAREWHPTKNDKLTAYDVTAGSERKVWWLGQCGHEWQAEIKGRKKGNGCPFCAGKKVCQDNNLAFLMPELAKEWHALKNNGLTPEEVTAGSRRRIWWLCEKGHEWQAQIGSRKNGSACPYCTGRKVGADNNLAFLMPELAKEWHPTRNGKRTAYDVTQGSNVRVWWIGSCGHEWEALVAERTRGRACPYCANKKVGADNNLAVLMPEIAKEWHPSKNDGLTPEKVTAGSHRRVWWICRWGHEWQAQVKHRVLGTGCPLCSPQTSRLEIRILCELRQILPGVKWRESIGGAECDIFLSQHKIGIEIDGYYWHKSKEERDHKKANALALAGILLVRIRDVGLRKLSNTDITLNSPQDAQNHLAIVHRLLRKVRQVADFSGDDLARINKYLRDNSLANDSEYRHILSHIPGPLPEKSLAVLSPEISRQWNHEKNGALHPRMFTLHSGEKVWWVCDQGHEWETSINDRSKGHGCPYCSGNKVVKVNCLSTVNPPLAEQWHPTKNVEITPQDVSAGSGKKVWWICKHGHDWQAKISVRNRGSGCPQCWNKRRGTRKRV
jgi:very-short-patch-repair endonuclease